MYDLHKFLCWPYSVMNGGFQAYGEPQYAIAAAILAPRLLSGTVPSANTHSPRQG